MGLARVRAHSVACLRAGDRSVTPSARVEAVRRCSLHRQRPVMPCLLGCWMEPGERSERGLAALTGAGAGPRGTRERCGFGEREP
jgi:hypothetical protein